MQAPIDDMVNYVRGLIAVAVNEPDTICQRHIDTSIGLSENDIVYRYKDEYVSTIGRIREDVVELVWDLNESTRKFNEKYRHENCSK